jgi:hypothetical protein
VKTNESTFIVIMGWCVGAMPLLFWNERLNKGGLEIRERQGNVEPTSVVTDYSSLFTIKHPGGNGECSTNIEAGGIKLKFNIHNILKNFNCVEYDLFVENTD